MSIYSVESDRYKLNTNCEYIWTINGLMETVKLVMCTYLLLVFFKCLSFSGVY